MKRILIALFFLLFVISLSYGLQLPNRGKYKRLPDRMRQVEESDVENSRAEDPTRKASENKRPWQSSDFLEMEDYVWPDFGRWPDWELRFPSLDGYGDQGVRSNANYDYTWYYDKGCILNCPVTWLDCGAPFT